MIVTEYVVFNNYEFISSNSERKKLWSYISAQICEFILKFYIFLEIVNSQLQEKLSELWDFFIFWLYIYLFIYYSIADTDFHCNSVASLLNSN